MSRLKENLEKAKERSKLLDQCKELQRQAQSVSEGINLNPNRRSDNLRLLRAYMNERQGDFASLLEIGSQSQYSKIERGESSLNQNHARQIEASLGLSVGWLERNNGDAIFLSNDEFLLLQTIRHSPSGATTALTEAVRKLLPP